MRLFLALFALAVPSLSHAAPSQPLTMFVAQETFDLDALRSKGATNAAEFVVAWLPPRSVVLGYTITSKTAWAVAEGVVTSPGADAAIATPCIAGVMYPYATAYGIGSGPPDNGVSLMALLPDGGLFEIAVSELQGPYLPPDYTPSPVYYQDLVAGGFTVTVVWAQLPPLQ